jgi:hypothetical protein
MEKIAIHVRLSTCPSYIQLLGRWKIFNIRTCPHTDRGLHLRTEVSTYGQGCPQTHMSTFSNTPNFFQHSQLFPTPPPFQIPNFPIPQRFPTHPTFPIRRYVDMCVCGHVCMWTCLYVDTCMWTCVCGYVCMWICVCELLLRVLKKGFLS